MHEHVTRDAELPLLVDHSRAGSRDVASAGADERLASPFSRFSCGSSCASCSAPGRHGRLVRHSSASRRASPERDAGPAASQQATGAAMRSEACAATPGEREDRVEVLLRRHRDPELLGVLGQSAPGQLA